VSTSSCLAAKQVNSAVEDILILEAGTNMFSCNVTNYRTLCHKKIEYLNYTAAKASNLAK
jgi:hypothetical protein